MLDALLERPFVAAGCQCIQVEVTAELPIAEIVAPLLEERTLFPSKQVVDAEAASVGWGCF